MITLRERKKKDRNGRIQNSALELFGAQGFAKTTISQIAEKADVGVGTVYNYYKSKEEILFSIIQDHSGEYISKFEKIIIDADEDIYESVAAFIDIYLKSFSIYNKTIWRELIAAGLSTNQTVMTFVDKVDSVFLNKFAELLDKFKQRKLIPKNIEASQIVSIIYSVLMSNILRYISNEKMTLDELKNILMKQMKIILKIGF